MIIINLLNFILFCFVTALDFLERLVLTDEVEHISASLSNLGEVVYPCFRCNASKRYESRLISSWGVEGHVQIGRELNLNPKHEPQNQSVDIK